MLARFSNGNALVANVSSQRCSPGHEGFACQPRCHITLRCICHERISLRRPFQYASTHSPSLFIIPPFLSRDPLLWDVFDIDQPSFHRLISTVPGTNERKARGGKRGARRKATMNVTNRVWKFWRPNFFLFFFSLSLLALLLCSILLNYRVPTKIKLANCPFIRRARTLLKYSCGSNNKPARCVPPGNLAECIRSIDYPG